MSSENAPHEGFSHADMLDNARRLALDPDPVGREDAVVYIRDNGAIMPPEVAKTLEVWSILLADDNPDIRLAAQHAFESAAASGQFPEELVMPLMHGFTEPDDI